MINEANEPSSACRLWRVSQVETSTPPFAAWVLSVIFECRSSDLFLLRFIGRIEGVLERDQVFARPQCIQCCLLGLELLVGISGRLDRKPDAPVALVNLDDARSDFLADL